MFFKPLTGMRNILVFILLLTCQNILCQINVAESLVSKGYGKNSWAIIVANEDYQSYSNVYVENEELAILQAEKFQQMLIKKAGVLPQHILFYADAVNTNIKLAISRLQKTLPAHSSLIFYYRGKTYNGGDSDDLYLVPVDVSDNETFYMFSIKDLFKRLSAIDANSIMVFIDSRTGSKTGISSIIDNGYTETASPLPSAKGISLLTLKSTRSALKEQTPVINEAKPIINISAPSSTNTDTKESSFLVRGHVKSDCPLKVVSVNGQEAHFGSDGTFIARVALAEGENNIAVEAENCAGRAKEMIIFNYVRAGTDPADAADSASFAENNTLKELGRNFALIIGESKYRDPEMPDLFYPTSDARKVRDALINNYTFDPVNVLFLENGTKKTITGKLDSLNGIINSRDNLLIFYAGHGSWDEKNNIGYWLPSDASARIVDSWLMNSIITGYVSRSNARHTLVIADACFGGSIFRTRAFKPEEEKTVSDLYLKMSKKAMTSGDLTEVPDESVFVKNFILLLIENREMYLPSEKLFFELKPKISGTADLIPQFGVIKNAGDQGGDFIFFRKNESH